MGLTVTRRLHCPACGDPVGDAVHRRWPGSLTLRAPEGHEVNPVAAGVMRRIVEREISEGDTAVARARLEYVTANITDPIYDLRCGRGHSTLRTAPEIIKTMKAAGGAWVTLR